jgi:hypothetical protein
MMRHLPFAHKDGLKAYERYFVDTYEKLDEMNKIVMAFYVEYFQAVKLARHEG